MKKIILIFCKGIIVVLKPVKIFAYKTKYGFLKRCIIQFTTLIDFILHFIFGQNEVMEANKDAFKGNFIFGHGIMQTDYDKTFEEIQQPSMRTNHFMGIPVVSSNEVFVVNSPLISLGEPFRTLARNHADKTIFNEAFYALTYSDIEDKCSGMIKEWIADNDPQENYKMRSICTRMVIYLLENIDIGKEISESVTKAYLKGFVELSLFKNYLPIVSGLIGTEKKIKKDAYYPLTNLGISPPLVDATLFAAMFSIGTLFTKCVDYLKEHNIDYNTLNLTERMNYVTEVVRLYPTVTTTHRILEKPETIKVAGNEIQLTEGDEIVYPFITCNKDGDQFKCPHQIKMDREKAEYDKILSWSKGAHACPAKDFSVLITTIMLDSLHKKMPLNSLSYDGKIL